jgi:hypothetical protein
LVWENEEVLVSVPSASVLSLKLNDEHTAADKLRDSFEPGSCSDLAALQEFLSMGN